MSPSTFRSRARLVLASFVAAVVVALLAPFVHFVPPVESEEVCSAHGSSKRVSVDHRTMSLPGSDHADHGVHCPLCLPAGAPPASFVWDAEAVRPLAHAQRPIPAARLASLVGAPLPARGPPRSV